ncbi:hypothetical protein EVA_18943 [gut metagenome]|uniref:Uncharacterized protein n=1 Tax=gut metagenome TaxID=749906 RepID=J9G015_9ZZZZ
MIVQKVFVTGEERPFRWNTASFMRNMGSRSAEES